MNYTLVWSSRFVEAFQHLTLADAQSIANNVGLLIRDPAPEVGTVLEISDDLYVLRVGRFDVVYEIAGATIRLAELIDRLAGPPATD